MDKYMVASVVIGATAAGISINPLQGLGINPLQFL